MRKIILGLGALMVISGSAGVIYSTAAGRLDFNLVFIVPVISTDYPLGVLSFILLLTGSIMLGSYFAFSRFIGDNGFETITSQDRGNSKGKGGKVRSGNGKRWGGVIFLGPIPIIIGNRGFFRDMPLWVIGIAVMAIISIISAAIVLFWIIQ